MAADDRVDAGHRLGGADIGGRALVGERDDVADAVGLERRDRLGQVGDRIAERHRRSRRGDLGGVRRQHAHDRHALAADLEDHRIAVERPEPVVARRLDIAEHDREIGFLDEGRERLRPEVELVVAEHHRVEADAVHELDLGLPREGGEEERARELVARVEHEQVAALRRDLRALGLDRGGEPRDTAEALARRLGLGAAGRAGAGNRFDAAVEIVDVQEMERERLCAAAKRDECARGEKKGTKGHGRAPAA
jgi:hypothetical protein